MWFTIIAAILVAALIYKLFFNSNKNYWKDLGVREIDTSAGCGKLELLLGRKGMSDADDYGYVQAGSDKYWGVEEMGTKILFVKDMELMKRILIKDFDHFVDRRDFFKEQDKTLARMLPSLKGDEWKGVRGSVSPTFTTGKIRRMMEYFNGVGKEWVDDLTNKAKKTGFVNVDIHNSINQYTIDVIGSAVFGMNTGTIKNPDTPFYKMALKLSDQGILQVIKMMLSIQFSSLFRLFRIPLINLQVIDFFEKILDQGLKQRMTGSVKRNDFLQLLVEAKKGELKAVGNDELSAFEKEAQIGTTGDKKQYLTQEIMNAQSLVFFFAGFTTTSNFIAWVIYILAAHQDVQERLRAEVNKIAKSDGTLDYDELNQLAYLDMVVCETFRMYPAAGRLERQCNKEWKDEETGLVIPKGQVVGIPVNAIHHDRKYYENPDKFDPEHFSAANKSNRSPYAYLPFGMGPRNCIGMRFALIESKAAVAHLVHNFKIEPSAKTPLPIQGRPVGLQLVVPKGLELKLTPIPK